MRILGYEISLSRAKPPENGTKTVERSAKLTSAEILRILTGEMQYGGLPASDQEVMSVSPAFAAVAYISKSVASLPFTVYRRNERGQTLAENHPVFHLFAGRPHPLYTRYNFFSALVSNALLGDGYARIHYNEAMRPTALEILPRQMVWPEFAADGKLYYRVSGTLNGQSVTFVLADWEVIHIKGLTFNGVQGLPIRLIHKDTLGMGAAAQEYSRVFFENGTHIDGYIKTPNPLAKPDSGDKIRSEWKKKFGGIANVGEIPVLDGGMEYVKIGLNPQEAAVIDFRKLTVQDCARIWQIPIHLLGDLDRSSFSNIEQQNADFLTYTLMPLIAQIEDELDTKLFSASEIKGRRYFTRFDMAAFTRSDLKSRADFYATAIQNGIMTNNEVRGELMLNPIEGGDSLIVQLNMQKLETMGQQPATTATPKAGAIEDDTETENPQPNASNG